MAREGWDTSKAKPASCKFSPCSATHCFVQQICCIIWMVCHTIWSNHCPQNVTFKCFYKFNRKSGASYRNRVWINMNSLISWRWRFCSFAKSLENIFYPLILVTWYLFLLACAKCITSSRIISWGISKLLLLHDKSKISSFSLRQSPGFHIS